MNFLRGVGRSLIGRSSTVQKKASTSLLSTSSSFPVSFTNFSRQFSKESEMDPLYLATLQNQEPTLEASSEFALSHEVDMSIPDDVDFGNEEKQQRLVKGLIRPKKRYKIIDSLGRSNGRGKRKRARAMVFIKRGTGECVVNGIPHTEYFEAWDRRGAFIAPFEVTGTCGLFDVYARVSGGGLTSQSQAIRLSIARALEHFDPVYRPFLKKHKLLSVDSRVAERKKPGQKGARAKFQWVKR